jgi:hypothetical protein
MNSRLSIALLGCLLFVMGGVAGWVGHCLYLEHLPQGKTSTGTSMTPQEVMDGLAQKLELDAEQKEALKAIFEESRDHYWELNREFKPRYEAIRNDSDDKIRAILRGSQKERFEEMLKKYRPKKQASGS